MRNFIDVEGVRIEYQWTGKSNRNPSRDNPVIVFLHEGLGSTAMWKKFPNNICKQNNLAGLVYSRCGYGWSSFPERTEKEYSMEYEADVILPALITALKIRNPLFLGHSDGASIALLAAANSLLSPVGIVAMAPHVFVEDITLCSIGALKKNYKKNGLAQKLARYHRDPDAMFFRWLDMWLDSKFRSWDLTSILDRIRAPILLIQGENDQFGSSKQLDAIRDNVKVSVDLHLLSDCAHFPHVESAERVEKLVTNFINSTMH